jgi:hypothetical protein
MIALIVDTRVMRVVVRREHTVFNERSDADRSKHLAEAHIVIAFVSGETSKIACVSQSDLRADSHPARPLCATVQVYDRSFSGVNQECRLDRSHGRPVRLR